jgi:hypothetical protein
MTTSSVNKNMARQNEPIRAKAETVEILRFPGNLFCRQVPATEAVRWHAQAFRQ